MRLTHHLIDGNTLAASRTAGLDALGMSVWVLRGMLAVAAVLAAATAYVALGLPHDDAGTWVTMGVAAIAIAVLALRLFTMAAPRLLRARGWLDAATGLGNLRSLPAVGALLLRRARRADQPLSLVVMEFSDLLQARPMYGAAVADRLLAIVVQRLRALASRCPGAVAIHVGRARFAILLPGCPPHEAMRTVFQAMGDNGCIEYDAGDVEAVLIPQAVCADVVAAGAPVYGVYHQLLQRIESARLMAGARNKVARPLRAKWEMR